MNIGEHNLTMKQEAPYPHALRDLVVRLKYKPGWNFSLGDVDRGQGSEGLTLIVHVTTEDGYHPEQKRSVVHYMIVPAAAFDKRSWQRWLFDQIRLIELHETCEFFRLEEVRPYKPNHGPGRDPYVQMEVGTEVDAATSFRGVVKA